MPVARFRLRNEYGHADPELYGAADRDDPEALLEGVAMAGLVGVLRQLGDLAEFAAGIFHNLHEEVMSTSARGHSLMLRVQQLEAEFPAIEKAFLSQTTHLHTINNTGTEWHPNIQIGQNLITSGDMPRFILDSYEECRGPPRLFMLDKFDVTGAGACLKRYSDPSFYKTDLAFSGTIEAGLQQREKRPRKTKKKNLRRRNDENLESSPDLHPSILNHMHPEKAQTFPTKRVKLKTRPLNNKDATTRSYMECVLESYISIEHISNINTIEHSPENTSLEPSVPILEIHATTTVVSSDSYLSLDKQVQSATDRGVEGENADGEKKNEIEKIITKSLPIDETGLLLQSFGSPEKIKRKDEGNALEQLFKENSIQSNQHVVPANSEDRTDAGSDVYVSDDIASDLENYMDALATIESEIETDSENRPKPQFSPSNEELQEMDLEASDEKNRKNLQILYANLTEDQNSNSLSEREVSCLANKDFLSISSDPDSVQKGQVQSPMCENAEITFSPVNKDFFCDPIQPLRVDEVHSLAHQNQSSDSPVNAGANSGGEHDLIFEQGHSHVSEKLFDMSSSIFETVEASCTSLPMNTASRTDSGTQGSCGTNNPTCVNPYTPYFGSLDADGVCQQSDFTPGENFATTDIANIVSSISDGADSTRALTRISDSDFKCLVDDYEPPSSINESPVEDAQIEDAIPDVSQEVLLDAENLTLITNSEDNHEAIPCLDYAIDPIQDTLTTGIPNSDDYDGVYSWNDQSLLASGEVEPCQLQKNEINGHPGFDILSVNAERDAPVTSLDVSPDVIVAEPGPATTVSDTKDLDDMWSTSANVNAISFVDKSQTFKAERDELFPNNAVSAKLPIPSSTDHDLLGSAEVFSDALDNDGIELSVIPEDQLSLSSSCITSESCLPSVEEHTTPSNFVSDHAKSEENNYGQHYSPFSHSSVQLSKDTTTSDPVPEKHDPEKDECLGSVIQEKLVTNRASGILSQNEENGETLIQESTDIFYHEKLSSSCGELPALKSVSADRDKTGEQDVAQEALPRHDFVPDMPDEHADVSITELHAQRTCEDPCQGNEVEIGKNEKKPRQENMISVGELTDLNPGQLCQYSDKEEVEVAVIQKISDKEEIIFQSPDVSYSDTINDISFVHKPMQITAVSCNEDNSRASLAESDAGPNLESLSHRTAEGYVSLTPEPSTAGTIQLTSESISSVIPISISGDKENSSDQDSQLDAVHILEQVCFSHASQRLSDSQTVPSMPCRTSVTDGSKDNIETDLSHSKADPNISPTDSGMIPFLFSLKSSSETLGRKDESNLLLLNSSACAVEAHSEAKVVLQSDFKLSIMPSDHSPQLSVVSFSGPNLPVANPALMNASESMGNGSLFNFPLLGPDIQCNLNDAPPLPPLPPLQWRMGKPKISHQGSIATTSKSSGSDDFSIISANELPSNDPKTLRVSVQCAETFSQPVLIENQTSQGGSTEDVPSSASANTSLTEKEGSGRFGSISVCSHEENLRTKSLSSDATDVKIENSLRRRKALQDEMAPSTNAFAPLLPSSEIDSQRISSISYTEHVQLSSQSILPPTQGIDVHQNYTVMPRSFQTDLLYPSNPFRDAPVTMDPRYQYGYRLFGGESLQLLATQDIIPCHGFYMPVGESMYGPYSISLTEMETEKLNGRPLSILNRPRDPLIEAVASHDKSTLRKVSEIVQTSAKPKDDERNTMLDQIKQKSFNLKRTAVTRPSISKGHTTNLKVAAILEKANAIRQAFVGSDDEDNWSDG